MILIIDAYNVLKQVTHEVRISRVARQRFIAQLGRYAKRKGHILIVVFDGGPYDRPFQEKIAGVQVIFSGRETADHYIKSYIAGHQSRDILVISSDREIGLWASDHGVASLDAVEFYRLLQEKTSQEPLQESMAIKTSHSGVPELDILMEESFVESKAEASRMPERQRPGQKLTKRERDMLKKLKKL